MHSNLIRVHAHDTCAVSEKGRVTVCKRVLETSPNVLPTCLSCIIFLDVFFSFFTTSSFSTTVDVGRMQLQGFGFRLSLKPCRGRMNEN
jgi:hypothetical protein